MSDANSPADKPFVIGEQEFSSRLIMGTGKFRSVDEMTAAFEAGGTQMITVALRRLDLDDPSKRTLLDEIDWKRYQILPNTAGCKTCEEAVRVARLARAMGLSPFIKLEVIPDPKYLLPDPVETLNAARILVDDGFVVMPYINDDPVLATRMQDVGCATVMPLAAPIGTGMGFDVNFEKIRIIREMCHVPVIVDAGLGVPSDASIAMEMGCDAVLVNSAIALAKNPSLMAKAFRLGVEAGRAAYLAGRMPRKAYAAATSPSEGVVGKAP